MAIKDILKTIETPYVDAQTLLSLLSDYQKPRECISRMVKNNELMRLKNGFYLITDKIRRGTNTLIPYEQVANLLYGPSYVSLEWALSFYGMIPERVHTVTSMTLGKNKEYHTPIGDFVYYKLSSNSYSIGVTQKKATDSPGGFLMASPEKALADLVFKTCKGLDKEGVRQELLESKRIDREHFHRLDKVLLGEIAKAYHAKSVDYLADLVGVL
jgi:predicted transcriptional regulator of viral defense system